MGTSIDRPRLSLLTPPEDSLQRLLEVGRTLISELEPESVLERILSEARAITGARYAALGVLDPTRERLERFLTSGIDAAGRRAIGELPRGRGVLGVLISDPRPLRLHDVGEHPESYGFPAGHPPMRSFLGVPIVIRGEPWGNLYLAEKEGGDFTQRDEDAILALSQWAGVAIENARVHAASEERRIALERAVRSLEASRDISEAIGSADEIDDVLALIVKRGRALVGAQTLLIMLREDDQLVVSAQAGHGRGARGRRLPVAGSTSGEVMRSARARRIDDANREMLISPTELGIKAHTALLVPMLHRGAAIGVLAAFDHGVAAASEFSSDDELLLHSFAQSAANAVAIKRSVDADRLHAAIAAAEAERGRWARELHDQTLQALAGLRVLLASSLKRSDEGALQDATRRAVDDLELEIANLRAIITDLRPALLDDLGLEAAIGALLERRRRDELQIESDIRLGPSRSDRKLLPPMLETCAYRIVQEALTNVIKHARARNVRVTVALEGAELLIEIVDDGVGFDPNARSEGFGLAGVRERVALADGELRLDSGESGTRLHARLPVAGARAGVAQEPIRWRPSA